ncbi:unnamed protein product [Cyclocybe aegerita]|uniref:Ser-Thr-rich glycosyl-phosphatidyl-inositol-anchored membrane family-domain-containing protein n=1 Tax=Cyclocybe aegerita TaxID=1973307 RepID=A0A8S0VSI8_CYCAE|nr:unnamed protein product [Cyclocybe aegerita]
MKYFAATAALVALVPSVLALTINTPSAKFLILPYNKPNVPALHTVLAWFNASPEPTLLTFEGGSPPYYLTIIPGGQASAQPLKSFPPQSGNTVTWVSDIAQGTSVTFALKDSTGLTAFTDAVTVQTSTDKSCITGSTDATVPVAPDSTDGTSTGSAGSAPSASAPAGAAVSSTHAASVASAPGAAHPTTPAVVAVGTTSRAVAAAGTTPAATSSATGVATNNNTSGAESRVNIGSYGIVGVLGLLGAMFL